MWRTGCICPQGSLYARFSDRSTPRRSSSKAAVKSWSSPFSLARNCLLLDLALEDGGIDVQYRGSF